MWLVVPFGTALVVVGPWVIPQHRRIGIEGDKRVVAAALLFTLKVAVSELALDKARVLNLDERTGSKPILQLGSMGLPGFRAGNCLLRNRNRAFCLLTARDNILLLPQHDVEFILPSPEKPQALLLCLRELAEQDLPSHPLAQGMARR